MHKARTAPIENEIPQAYAAPTTPIASNPNLPFTKAISRKTLITLTLFSFLSLKVICDKGKNVISTGKIFPSLKPFDELMEKFVLENEIPGASLAVAKDGRLVYARGFGYGDIKERSACHSGTLANSYCA